MSKLTPEEEMFCALYADGADLRSAAARSGFTESPEKTALKLLRKRSIMRRVEAERKGRAPLSDEVLEGYRRLAFGSVADALRLVVCCEEMTPQDIEKLELMNISEIKKPKGGGIEVKFFDRLKALEKLSSLSPAEDRAGELLRAINDASHSFADE